MKHLGMLKLSGYETMALMLRHMGYVMIIIRGLDMSRDRYCRGVLSMSR